MKIRIGKRTLDQLPTTEKRNGVRHSDTELAGFFVFKYPSGRIVYFVSYGGRGNRKSMKIGTYPPMPPDSARAAAAKILLQYQTGEDPVEDEKKAAEEVTFAKWKETYMVEVERRKKHPRNDRRYLGMAEERWAGKRLNEITVADVRKLFESITSKGKPIDDLFASS